MVELLLRPDLGKKPYRLKCRFTIEANHKPEFLERVKFQVAEAFVIDMKKQGWEYDPNRIPPNQRGFKLTGPYPATPVTGLPTKAEQFRFSAKRDMARVMAGDPMRLPPTSWAKSVPILGETDKWEYELSAVFIRETILVETQGPTGS